MSSIRLVAQGKVGGKVRAPPSKSYTHRAVIMASLSSGRSRVYNPLVSRDTTATFDACRAMGASLEESGSSLTVTGSRPYASEEVVNVENSGTTLRFMTSVFVLPERGFTLLTGDASIRRRPMQGLLDALSRLDAKAQSAMGNGCAPIVIGEGGMGGGDVEMRGDTSSQFVSSILISAPLARGNSSLRVVGAVSRPYIEATLRLSELHGIDIKREGRSIFRIMGRQEYRPMDFVVPGDFGSAAFLMGAVALVGGEVELSGLSTSLPQADSAIIEILERLGVDVRSTPDSMVVRGDGKSLAGGEFDLRDSPDLLPVLSVLSLKCESPLEIHGVTHAKFKESDRISVAAEGLRRIGAKVEERPDGLRVIKPEDLTPALLDAHDDHRMFMAFALASLIASRVRVSGIETLDVSYPSFLEDMERVGVRVARN